MLGALLIALSIDPQIGPTAPPPPLGELTLVVAAPVYQPDGATRAETVEVMDKTEFIYGRRSLCDPATATGKEPVDAGYGWRLTARTINRTTAELVVAVEWRRLWDGGQKVANGPSGSVELTLHPGDRIALDHIPNAPGNTACRAVGMGLEVRLTRSPAPIAQPGVMPLGSVEGGIGTLDADVWLVHQKPAGAEEVLHQKIRMPPSGAPFNFAPVKFTTAQGEVGVEISGSFRRLRAAGGLEQIIVSMSRLVTGSTAPPAGLGGSTAKLIGLPSPSDVLSFEMPPAGAVMRSGGGGGRGGVVGAGGGPPAPRGGAPRSMGSAQAVGILEGHNFSIRVQVTPAER